MPIVSVIVPVYKVEPYLCRCVDSILNQTFPDFEVILVDDGSPDNCGRICDEYAEKDSRIRVIHQENAGPSAARNAGIEVSSGEYLTFVDSDDWVHPQYLEGLYTSAKKHDTLVACCEYDRTSVYEEPALIHKPFICSLKKPEEVYTYPEARGIQAYIWRYIIHRSLFNEVRFPVGRMWEDMFTTPKLIFQCKYVAWTDAKLYYYYNRMGSIVNSSWNLSKWDNIEAIKFNLMYFKEHPYVMLKNACLTEFINSVNENMVQLMHSNLSKAEKKDIIKSFQGELKTVMTDYVGYKSLTLQQRMQILCINYPVLWVIWDKMYGVKANLWDRIQMMKK